MSLCCLGESERPQWRHWSPHNSWSCQHTSSRFCVRSTHTTWQGLSHRWRKVSIQMDTHRYIPIQACFMCTHMHSTHTHACQQERITKWEAYRRVHTYTLHVFLCVYTCRATIDSVENDEIGGAGARTHTHTHTHTHTFTSTIEMVHNIWLFHCAMCYLESSLLVCCRT